MRAAARKRLGIPKGFRLVYGALVSNDKADEVRYAMQHLKRQRARRKK